MGRRLFLYFLLTCFLCSGCRFQPSHNPLNRVVTKISIIYQNGGFTSQRDYTDDENTRQILNYLRLINPYGKPEENPETVSGHEYRILLFHEDTVTTEYRQKDDRFFMNPDGKWLNINPNQGQKLGWLLWKIRTGQSSISISS